MWFLWAWNFPRRLITGEQFRCYSFMGATSLYGGFRKWGTQPTFYGIFENHMIVGNGMQWGFKPRNSPSVKAIGASYSDTQWVADLTDWIRKFRSFRRFCWAFQMFVWTPLQAGANVNFTAFLNERSQPQAKAKGLAKLWLSMDFLFPIELTIDPKCMKLI